MRSLQHSKLLVSRKIRHRINQLAACHRTAAGLQAAARHLLHQPQYIFGMNKDVGVVLEQEQTVEAVCDHFPHLHALLEYACKLVCWRCSRAEQCAQV